MASRPFGKVEYESPWDGFLAIFTSLLDFTGFFLNDVAVRNAQYLQETYPPHTYL